MAFTPTPLLTSDPIINLRDQEHAARLFSDNQFALAPKQKFSFHVFFSINLGALSTIDLVQKYGSNLGMLVKSVDLPNYSVETEMLNQYNRKKVVQYQHKPGEIGVKFHDDNLGVINLLWQNYYSYYYADPTSAQTSGAYNRNATKSSDFIVSPYGLDNGSTTPFFNYIKIYQMARHEYVCYKLFNPIIKTWNHNRMDYAGNQPNEFDMKLAYEAVTYSSGVVSTDTVEGFGQANYDQTPSPLSSQGGGPDLSSTLTSQSNQANADQFLSNLIQTVNNYQNSPPQASPGTAGLLNTNTVQGVSGLNGINFPTSTAGTNTSTVANPVNLG
jgi:hypothetical protein